MTIQIDKDDEIDARPTARDLPPTPNQEEHEMDPRHAPRDMPPTEDDNEMDSECQTKRPTKDDLLVNNIRRGPHPGSLLEVKKLDLSEFKTDRDHLDGLARVAEATDDANERQKFRQLEQHYGWMRNVRLKEQESDTDCRWVHYPSTLPSDLAGFLWAFHEDQKTIAASLKLLEDAIRRHTRNSKHGNFFAPFSQSLAPTDTAPLVTDEPHHFPVLLSIPFLDVIEESRPLRPQVNRRVDSWTAPHFSRSLLQYLYRLEDTSDREPSQVFAKYKPWSSNPELDRKVRQWYGYYPTALNVEEMWILLVDARNMVTFSSKQFWDHLSSPQLDENLRVINYSLRQTDEYNAVTHALVFIGEALSMVQPTFRSDGVLHVADRYAGYLETLRYRRYRDPSTELAMDLTSCQEELEIVMHITQQQLHTIANLSKLFAPVFGPEATTSPPPLPMVPKAFVDQVLKNLQLELAYLKELHNYADHLVKRTIQQLNSCPLGLVKAVFFLLIILLLIIFLPFIIFPPFRSIAIYLDRICPTESTAWLFWVVALYLPAVVYVCGVFAAYSVLSLLERDPMWWDRMQVWSLRTATAIWQRLGQPDGQGA